MNIASLAVMDEFTITNGQGQSQKLYVRNGGQTLSQKLRAAEQLPPEPPRGLFYARFASGKFIESVPASNLRQRMPISLRDASYPVTISWKLKEVNYLSHWLFEPGNPQSRIPLYGDGELRLSDDGSDVIVLETQSTAPPPCDPTKAGITRHSEDNANMPSNYSMKQNYPNPFNPTTTFNYQLAQPGRVSLVIYDILGQEVKRLVDNSNDPGYYSVTWDATSASSGLYYARIIITAANGDEVYRDTKKVLLMK